MSKVHPCVSRVSSILLGNPQGASCFESSSRYSGELRKSACQEANLLDNIIFITDLRCFFRVQSLTRTQFIAPFCENGRQNFRHCESFAVKRSLRCEICRLKWANEFPLFQGKNGFACISRCHGKVNGSENYWGKESMWDVYLI